jgi:predicted RNase H-like HicB family nuclease
VKILAKASSRASNATSLRPSAKAGSRTPSKTRPVKSYQAHYALDETGWWLATIAAIPGCHTQGRTLEQAEKRLREALSLFISARAAAGVRLVARVALSPNASRKLLAATTKRNAANALAKQSQDATRAAARTLARDGLSLRDVGRLLSVTRQRAHQLVSGNS